MWTMNLFDAIFTAIGFVVLVGLSGAAWTFGCALAARSMKWAPINITVKYARVRCAECDCGDGPCNWITPATNPG